MFLQLNVWASLCGMMDVLWLTLKGCFHICCSEFIQNLMLRCEPTRMICDITDTLEVNPGIHWMDLTVNEGMKNICIFISSIFQLARWSRCRFKDFNVVILLVRHTLANSNVCLKTWVEGIFIRKPFLFNSFLCLCIYLRSENYRCSRCRPYTCRACSCRRAPLDCRSNRMHILMKGGNTEKERDRALWASTPTCWHFGALMTIL